MSDRAVEGVLVSDHLCDTVRRRRGFPGVGDGGSQCVGRGGTVHPILRMLPYRRRFIINS